MLGREVTCELVEKEKPDAIIIATGSMQYIPQIFMEGRNVVFASDILAGTIEAGPSVIIVGGGVVGAETAEFLARKNKQVSIIEMLDGICADMPMFAREDLIRRLQELRVNILTETKVDKIDGNTVLANKRGRMQTLQADTIVIATGARSNRKLADELEGFIPELHIIGDCLRPRKILQAIHEGFNTGNKI